MFLKENGICIEGKRLFLKFKCMGFFLYKGFGVLYWSYKKIIGKNKYYKILFLIRNKFEDFYFNFIWKKKNLSLFFIYFLK